MRILGVITARGGSKGIPGKNIKILGKKPLIAYSIDVAKKSKIMTDVIVSTDDPKIASIAQKYGGKVSFLRPKKLATDKAKHIDVMRHSIEFMEKAKKVTFDYVVILQPTSPFRLVADIDETLKKLIKSKADSAVTLVEVEENHPIKMKRLDGDRVLPYCFPEPEGVRRQELPPVYKRSGAVYAMKRNLIMEKHLLFGKKVVGHVVPRERSVDIDTPFDWLRAKVLFGELKKKGYKF